MGKVGSSVVFADSHGDGEASPCNPESDDGGRAGLRLMNKASADRNRQLGAQSETLAALVRGLETVIDRHWSRVGDWRGKDGGVTDFVEPFMILV